MSHEQHPACLVYAAAVAEVKAPPGYKLLEEIGKGGMGVVYRASQLELDRVVALKLLKAPEGQELNPQAMRRLKSEAQIHAKFAHPNVVRLIDADPTGEVPYIALELVENARTLQDLLLTNPPPLGTVLSLFERIASALSYVHDFNVIHRDLKPHNILIDADGRPLLTDFGVSLDLVSSLTRFTGEFQLVGTPVYMSPEQIQREPFDHRADIYAFGIMLYEFACGKPVFSGEKPLVTFGARITDKIPPVTKFNPDLPVPVVDIIEQCIAFKAQSRFASAEELQGRITILVETAPADSGPAKLPPRPVSPPRVIQQRVPKGATGRLAPLHPGRISRPGIPAMPAPAPVRARRGWLIAVTAAVVGVGFAAMSGGRVILDRPPAPPSVATASQVSPAVAAENLAAAVHSLKHGDIGLAWLEGFAKRQRSSLAACGAGDERAGAELAGAVRANLEALKLLPSLNEFLGVARAYFADPEIAEERRWSTRTALLDIEYIERFCAYHRIPWTAVATGSLVAAVDAAFGEVVDPATLDLKKARSWIRGPHSTPDRYFPGESRLVHWQLPELPATERALLWFGTLRWPAGHLLDLTVNGKFRTIVRIPKPASEVPPIPVNAVEIADPQGTRAKPEHLVEAGTHEPEIRAFGGIWIPRAALRSKTELLVRIVDLPGARVEGMRNPSLLERIITFVPESAIDSAQARK